MICLLALSDSGIPTFDERLAKKISDFGVPCFGCTPNKLPELIEGARRPRRSKEGNDLRRLGGYWWLPHLLSRVGSLDSCATVLANGMARSEGHLISAWLDLLRTL